MYLDFFQLQTQPFENTPDPRFFYASEQHREALAAIEYTIRMRKGIVLVTGEIGSGKTTVGKTMLKRCANHATIVSLVHGHHTGVELLRHILRSLNITVDAHEDHALLLEKLQQHLQEQMHRGKPVVLFVDEAQTLSDEAIEELRLISNFDTTSHRLLQLVLVGQPELRESIRRPEMAALRQRIVLAKQLSPMSMQETAGYIGHRLSAASRDPRSVQASFSGEAIQAIYNYTRGIPRLINVICDNCLLLGFVKSRQRITGLMVQQVIQDMVPTFDNGCGVEGDTNYRLAGSF